MRNLTVCVCIDDRGGLTFLGRRLSRDRILLSDLFSSFGDEKIYVSPYSLSILGDYVGRYEVLEDPLSDAPDGAIIFHERGSLLPYIDDIESLVVYYWNRKYPFDEAVDIPLDEYRTIKRDEFAGSSHEKITRLQKRRKR